MMTPLNVILTLLALTFGLCTGKGYEDLKCSFDGTDEEKRILQMSFAAIYQNTEENLAVLDKKSTNIVVANPSTTNATGNISGKKGFLSLTVEQNLDVLKYVCRVLVKDKNQNVETIESFKENKGNRLLSIINELFAKSDEKNERLINMIDKKSVWRTKKSDEKIGERIKQVVNQSDQLVGKRLTQMEDTIEQRMKGMEERLKQLDEKSAERKKQIENRINLASGKNIRTETSCADFKNSKDMSRPLRVTITTKEGYPLLCDTYTDGGGWIVFQRRADGTINFYRNWKEYENGFGIFEHSFWLGLKRLSALTAQGKWQMRVDFIFKGKKYFAEYSDFKVGDRSTNYKLRAVAFSGNVHDDLKIHNGMAFSTFDKDRDGAGHNCAAKHHGGWWYGKNCMDSNLNGRWGSDSNKWDGVIWKKTTNRFSATFTEMKIRRIQ